ncbi:ATP-binding cassette domain-containing protein [Gemmatimonadota bacterium]
MATLKLSRAGKHYKSGSRRRVALRDCSFECDSGEIVGVIGPNGAGKTTMLRMISGETTVSSGEVIVAGYRAGTRRARRAVGYVGDPPMLPGELSGVEWLNYLSCHRASHPRERTALLQWSIDLADLGDFVGRQIAQYSRGMVQRLGLATAALTGSDVVVLDEVLSGVDPLVARRLRGTITKLSAIGRLVLVASHDLSTLERFATRVLVLWRGGLIADVNVARLASERVAELSLSGSGMSLCDRLLDRFSGAVRTEDGVAIPLTQGLTIEQTIAVCRSERIPVAASRVRFRVLEDILMGAAGHSEEQQ